QSPVVHARLGVRLGQVVMKLCALFDAALLQQHAPGVAVLEHIGIERESLLIIFRSQLILLPGEVGRAQIAVNGRRLRRVFQGARIAFDGVTVAYLRGVNDAAVSERSWIL